MIYGTSFKNKYQSLKELETCSLDIQMLEGEDLVSELLEKGPNFLGFLLLGMGRYTCRRNS